MGESRLKISAEKVAEILRLRDEGLTANDIRLIAEVSLATVYRTIHPEWRKLNDPEHLAKLASYRDANREKIQLNSRAYYKKNRAKILARSSKYTKEHREAISAKQKARYKERAALLKEKFPEIGIIAKKIVDK